ncbi:Chromosomal replication initiator protein DnaA [bioreactor metagenome]|uniref:Chromosomal replication initiator protein DnaA n=1 Tax=bioreactor metagenome TaxID=1076179 RepID=A0A644SVI3_9ZZZZ|nr:chromosomal replication initiator protein DnaA [Negativicutes bacterium]
METIQLEALWEQIMNHLEQELSSLTYNTWLKPMVPLCITKTTFEIGTSKKFIKEWVESRYFSIIQNTVQNITKQPLTLIITNMEEDETIPPIDIPQEQPAGNQPNETSQQLFTNIPAPIRPVYKPEPSSQNNFSSDEPLAILNPKYIFETFVIGNANRFAHAASLAVAEAPAQVYNPFFIYGGVGLGKTHLMHAIGHRILKTHPHLRVVYISSEKFTNELINSIRDGNPESFRQKYRNVDVLLVDDIQFLSKKEHTQEEFFHTFNTLHEANKQIIISSDRPPRDIQTLEDRLRSRFEWGLITDIQPPDLETRIAILRKKAMIENLNVPNDVMVFIASRIDNNIRELEGALIRVMAYASLTKQSIDIDLATEALKDIFPNGRPKEITMELIQEVVSSYFKIRIDDLLAKKRTRNVTYPRQIAMYLCREMTETSLPRIGEMFGGRDHTTVIHAHDKINRERAEDIKLSNTIKELIKRIESV